MSFAGHTTSHTGHTTSHTIQFPIIALSIKYEYKKIQRSNSKKKIIHQQQQQQKKCFLLNKIKKMYFYG